MRGLEDDLDAALDVDRLVTDVCRLIGTPSPCGDEAAGQVAVAALAERLGLRATCHDEDLTGLRAAPGFPGEEVERGRLVNVTVLAPGADPQAPRLCLAGHVDVVPPGDRAWTTDPLSAVERDGWIHGRGAADMKGGLVASLHGLAAATAVLGQPPGDVVVHSLAAEEDGGLGAFALLQRDRAFGGCVIAEPTGGAVVAAHGGALTWRGRVTGVAAHACNRLDGVSALDRFLPVYAALRRLEIALNTEVGHPLMRELPLPYPLNVGRVHAGAWASTVPDELVFDGRIGVPVGMTGAAVRALLEDTVRAAADDGGAGVEVAWTGGQFEPAETDVDERLVRLLAGYAASVAGSPSRLMGASYGSDMRLYCAAQVPAVLFGPGEVAQAHATDERVEIAAVVRHARVIARLAAGFGADEQPTVDMGDS